VYSIVSVSHLDYLELATRLLQRVRVEDPTAGLWEAADLQWWWRSERSSDSIDQVFWFEDSGQPVGGVVLTEWRGKWGCDLMVVPKLADHLVPTMWSHAIPRISELSLADVEVAVRDDDPLLIHLVTDAGFAAKEARSAATWMDSHDRPPIARIPAGYRLSDRTHAADLPHHFAARSGLGVAERLSQTSLYRPDLDLFVESTAGDVASYGLFWFDPTTKVGFVEPMRTEHGHEGLGLARHLLASGLERLAALGATRLKVNYEVGNQRAERLYLRAGFAVDSTSTAYARRGA
jgi:RimJ/RimL family protein N-acetyltransferase